MLKERGVKWLFPSFDSVYGGKDLIGQTHELSGRRGRGCEVCMVGGIRCSFFKKKLTLLLVRVCSLTQHNFQFYFREVLKPINEPSQNFQNLKKSYKKPVSIGKWNKACL